ncbi:AAA family ATPase [Leptotrichia massiliensis]|uniref:AAA family ATPase n=1 Tax=Leptotrichia massiliensis TaxID=1852388 RepID=UPI0028D540A8|nr:AAA family ATPase [Leptotrichia massiliensis]
MKLLIRNVGKLKEADVEINGITVIAGENNTGKSTVSKTLFSLFSGFYNLNEKISLTRLGNTRTIFLRFMENINKESAEILNNVSNELVNNSDYKNNKTKIFELIRRNKNFISEKDLKDITKKIIDILNIKDAEYLKNMVSYVLNNEFNNQINTIGSNDFGEIILKIKEEEIKIKIKSNEITIENKINLRAKVIYIDDPFVIDNLNDYKLRDVRYLENHKENLETKLVRENTEINISEKIIIEDKLKKITEKLEEVINGKIKFNQGKWIYELENNNELNLKNLSAGLKSFAILKRLVENGNLEEKGIVILDEPEIHLHPEWQIKFAELIVLLQKEFGMHILLTTHSPYFLKAIQVYSKKYEISDKCKYYMSELDGEQAILVDKTSKTDDLFYKLAISFENLMNEEELYED